MPLVSAVIPTYNRKHTVVHAIDSALAQTYKNMEIVVVDDCSNDGTAQYLQARYGEKIRLIALPDNVGGAQARNVGVENARGVLIAFLDSDDQWAQSKIARQVSIVQQQDVGVVYTGMYRLNNRNEILGLNTPRFSGAIGNALLTENVVSSTSSVLVRKELFVRVGGFNRRLRSCDDWDLWLRLARITTFGFLKEFMVSHYIDGEDRLSFNPRYRAHDLLYMYEEYVKASGTAIGRANVFFKLGHAFYLWNRWRYASVFFTKSFALNHRKYKALVYLLLCKLPGSGLKNFYCLTRLRYYFRKVLLVKNLAWQKSARYGTSR